MLADEMGLGKTAQALAIIAHYLEEDGPALIVTPASLPGVWRDQAKQWLRAQLASVLLESKKKPYPRPRLSTTSLAHYMQLFSIFVKEEHSKSAEHWGCCVLLGKQRNGRIERFLDMGMWVLSSVVNE